MSNSASKIQNLFVPQSELAKAANCSLTTIQTYRGSGAFDIIESNARGQYRMMDALAAIIDRLRAQAAGYKSENAEGEVVDLATASAELKVAQTKKTNEEIRLKQIAVERTLGNLIGRDDVDSAMRMVISSARAKFQAMPDRLVALVPTLTKKNVSDIRDEVRSVLESLSSDLPAVVEKQVDAAVEEAKKA